MMNDSSVATKSLFEIDKHLDELVKKIELLSYVNPINIESEKVKFFASKYLTDPVFIYPDIDFDRFRLHREFFSQPLELIQNDRLRNLYEDTIYTYSGLIQCIETIGNGKKFYYNSLPLFQNPTEQDVENTEFILHFHDDKAQECEVQNTTLHRPKKFLSVLPKTTTSPTTLALVNYGSYCHGVK